MALFHGDTATAAPDRAARRYDQIRAANITRNRKASRAGRDIGELPPVADQARRDESRRSFRRFCETYLPQTFKLAWSPDHLAVIDRIERATVDGGLFAFAMPRGSGKTSLVIAAALWSLLHSLRHFVAIIGADEKHARRMLDSLALELETNDLLLADFPEICAPIRALERIHQRARGQMHQGQPTRIVRTADELVLPTIASSPASGAVARVAGITGHLRGMTAKRQDGTTIRPSLVLIDDPQSDEVAHSPSQVATRLDIMRGAILGLAGPGQTIAGLATVTVIAPHDLADQLLDRSAHPEWQGQRTKLVYEWPTDEARWSQYAEIRRDGLRSGSGTAAATDFYRQHQAHMDAGARVGWAERFLPDELSAIQHAYNLRLDRGEASFQAEYQNEPILPELAAGGLSAEILRERIIALPRGTVPNAHGTLTASIDVQERVLFWLVASWGAGFSGHVVAYGTYPDQTTRQFTAKSARRTLAQVHRGGGFEATLAAGLKALADQLLAREWLTESGVPQRIKALVVDAGWGRSTATVREFARRHPSAAIIHPSHGRGIGATSRPLTDHKKRPGERIGPGWRTGTVGGQPGLLFDTNHWKGFLAGRLSTQTGDPGSLTLHSGDHEILFEHLASERPVSVTARGNTVDEWQLAPGAENHLLDCAVMAAVGASITGIEAAGAMTPGRARRKVSMPTRPEDRRRITVRRRRL
jgi:hypothetical protein